MRRDMIAMHPILAPTPGIIPRTRRYIPAGLPFMRRMPGRLRARPRTLRRMLATIRRKPGRPARSPKNLRRGFRSLGRTIRCLPRMHRSVPHMRRPMPSTPPILPRKTGTLPPSRRTIRPRLPTLALTRRALPPGCRVSARCFHPSRTEEHRRRAGKRFVAPTRPPRPKALARQRPRARSTKLGTDVPDRNSVPGPRAWAREIGSTTQGGSGQPARSAPAGREPGAFALRSDRPRRSRWQAASLPRAFDALTLPCRVADRWRPWLAGTATQRPVDSHLAHDHLQAVLISRGQLVEPRQQHLARMHQRPLPVARVLRAQPAEQSQPFIANALQRRPDLR